MTEIGALLNPFIAWFADLELEGKRYSSLLLQ